MRSMPQMVLSAFAVGLMLGAGVTRTARHIGDAHAFLFGGSPASSLPAVAGGDGSAAAAAPSPGELEAPEPAPTAPRVPLPLFTETLDGGSFLIIEDSGALPQMESIEWGLCRTAQKQTLDAEGFEKYVGDGSPTVGGDQPGDADDDEEAEGDDKVEERRGGHMGLPGCAASGRNRTVLVLSPMHNRAHQVAGFLLFVL